LPIAGKPLLRWMLDSFKKENVNDVTVVGGYCAAAIDTAGIRLVRNERHAQTGELASLACAVDALEADTVISYGDLLFRSYVLRDLMESAADFAIIVDSSQTGQINHTVRDFAFCSRGDDRGLFGTQVLLRRVLSGKSAAVGAESEERPHGRWIGLVKVSRRGLPALKAVMAELRTRPDFDALDMPTLLNSLVSNGACIEVLYVHGHWRGVNDLEEFRHAVEFAHSQTPIGSTPDAAASDRSA